MTVFVVADSERGREPVAAPDSAYTGAFAARVPQLSRAQLMRTAGWEWMAWADLEARARGGGADDAGAGPLFLPLKNLIERGYTPFASTA